MKLANTCGFVDGIFQERVDATTRTDARSTNALAYAPEQLTVRNTFLEPLDGDQDVVSLSDKAATDPGPLLRWHSLRSSSDNEQALMNSSQGLQSHVGLRRQRSSRDMDDIEQSTLGIQSSHPRVGIEVLGYSDGHSSASGLKSIGSAQHPHNCIECNFHVFNPAGCRAGKDCQYCHEEHPRQNPKKNRRYKMKHRVANKQSSTEEVNANASEQLSGVSTLPPPVENLPPGLEESVEATQEFRTSDPASSTESEPLAAWDSAGSSACSRESLSRKLGNADYISLAYMDREATDASPPKPLFMIAGIRAHFPARVTYAEGREAALRDNIEFIVTPPLPEGLALHKDNGLISGIPLSVGGPSMHRVVVSIDALGPNSVFLGKFPLTSCTISIHIVDLQRCVSSSVDQKSAANEIGHIVVQWRKH